MRDNSLTWLTFKFGAGDRIHVERNQLQQSMRVDCNWWDLKERAELFEHLDGAHLERFHSKLNSKLLPLVSRQFWLISYPIRVINFPCTCKNDITKRLFNSDGSIWCNSSSSLLSPFLPATDGSSGAVRWTLQPSSGWIHVSLRKFPSKRCSFSLRRRRFFSSRFFWLNSY